MFTARAAFQYLCRDGISAKNDLLWATGSPLMLISIHCGGALRSQRHHCYLAALRVAGLLERCKCERNADVDNRTRAADRHT